MSCLTYVTESPSWKPTYRVAVGGNGKVMLEGWAIVDNTSGEDWKGVLVGVGSSSALSFKYDLWSVRQVQRDTLHDQEQFAVAPPTRRHAVRRRRTPRTARRQIAEFDDAEIRRPAGHPEDKKAERVAINERRSTCADVDDGCSGATVSRGGGGAITAPAKVDTAIAHRTRHRRPPATARRRPTRASPPAIRR